MPKPETFFGRKIESASKKKKKKNPPFYSRPPSPPLAALGKKIDGRISGCERSVLKNFWSGV